ncbi:hypothetical protein KJ359_010274 [Pestalotiopsis sp. 9143b]|nr:hypothetical protein KJ359_010274 [Pestalotiopsis sp. 9143b]
MPFIFNLAMSTAALAAQLVQASGPFKFCSVDTCDTCPVQVLDAGTGYPNCVIYRTDDVFGGNDDFADLGSESGGYSVWLDVAEPERNCQTIIKSPARTVELGCGTPIAAYSHEACGHLELDTTFMVQSCCDDECDDAGLSTRSAKFPPDYLRARGSGGGGSGLYLHRRDGTRIEPIEVGLPPEYAGSQSSRPARRAVSADNLESCNDTPPQVTSKKRALFGRDKCTGYEDSWEQTDEYTRPADDSTMVKSGVNGGTAGNQIGVSTSRSQTWTSSVSMDFGFADVISMGLSFSEDESCQLTDTEQYTFSVPAGQVGNVYWTATLHCYTGTYACGDTRSDEIEICVPSKKGDEVVGTYTVVASN